MNKSRSDFEKWWIENSAVNDVDSQGYLKKDENGDYLSYHIDAGWLLWQASRAVEIDFSDAHIVCDGQNDFISIDIEDVYKRITEAGYKYKEQ